MIMLESQRLSWDVVVRLAAGDRRAAEQLWLAAGPAQQRCAGLVMATATGLVRALAQMQHRPVAPFRASDVPPDLCPDGRTAVMQLHINPAGLGDGWPDCPCNFELLLAQADLYLRQGEMLGFTRSEQGALINRALTAMDEQNGGAGLWAPPPMHDGHAEHADGHDGHMVNA